MVALGTFQWQEREVILSSDDIIIAAAGGGTAIQRYDTDGNLLSAIPFVSRLQMLWIQQPEWEEHEEELLNLSKPTNNDNNSNTKTTSYTWIMCRSATSPRDEIPCESANGCLIYDSSVKIRRTTTTTLSSNLDHLFQTNDLPSHAYWFHYYYYEPMPKKQSIRLIPIAATSPPPVPHKIPTAIAWDCLGEIPVALSIVLTCPPKQNADEPSSSSSSSSPLLQACLKRQMTGLILFWNNNNNHMYEEDGNKCSTNINTLGRQPQSIVTDTTTISLDFANQNWTFCLQTIRFKSSHNNNNHHNNPNQSGGWVRIVPSTNCTIIWSTQTSDHHHHYSSSFQSSSDLKVATVEPRMTSSVAAIRHPLESSSSSSSSSSPAYQFLYETVQQMHRHRNHQDVVVPKTVLIQSILLTGPPGVGKTHAVRTIRNEFGLELQVVPAFGRMGSTQLLESLRSFIEQQHRQGRTTQSDATTLTMVFLDECDAFFPPNDSEMVGIMESTLCYCLDHLASHVIVVAATNRPEALPNRVRIRFDRELHVGPPNRKERLQLLRTLLPSLQSSRSSSSSLSYAKEQQQQQRLESVAEDCVGYVAADLAALVARAHLLQIKAITAAEPMNGLRSKGEAVAENNWEDTEDTLVLKYLPIAMKDIKASALREIIPPSKTLLWDDIIGNDQVKTLLVQAIEWPVTKREAFRRLDLQPPRGILLYGPPGCAKTSLAKAAAHGRAFCAFSPADVYSTSYVGDAEAVIRNAFATARAAAPCILFFDELDALVVADGALSSRGNHVEARVLSTFLNEMDGLETTMGHDEMGSNSSGVLVLAATNRPSVLDAALLRPGRFDRLIYVPPPDEDARRRILQHFTDDMFDEEAVHLSEHMTGAEIIGACREALIKCAESGRIDDRRMDFVRSSVTQCLREVKPLLGDLVVRESYKSI